MPWCHPFDCRWSVLQIFYFFIFSFLHAMSAASWSTILGRYKWTFAIQVKLLEVHHSNSYAIKGKGELIHSWDTGNISLLLGYRKYFIAARIQKMCSFVICFGSFIARDLCRYSYYFIGSFDRTVCTYLNLILNFLLVTFNILLLDSSRTLLN